MNLPGMRPLAVVMLLLALGGCGQASRSTEVVAHGAVQQEEPPQQILSAFGGRLLGWDRGEFMGELVFEDEAGRHHRLLQENVHGIIENPEGNFVFTGLAHMGYTQGDIYRVTRDSTSQVKATLLTTLPGVPRDIRRRPHDVTTFWVYTDATLTEPSHQECYALIGGRHGRYEGCDAP